MMATRGGYAFGVGHNAERCGITPRPAGATGPDDGNGAMGKETIPPKERRTARITPFYVSADKVTLFRGAQGSPLNARAVRRSMAAARAALGPPPNAAPHALRQSLAAHLLKAGGELRVIQDLLGHNSLSTTQVNTAVEREQLLEAYERAHPRAQLGCAVQ